MIKLDEVKMNRINLFEIALLLPGSIQRKVSIVLVVFSSFIVNILT